jgi:hypothetical protein
MNDDWRLQIDVDDEGSGASLTERLDAAELEHELSVAFHDRLIVSVDGPRVFVYAGTREQAEQARDLIATLAETHGWAAKVELTHWHPAAEEWEDPDRPLAQTGEPEFEVRVDLPSHRDAAHFAELLQAEGLPAVRRWKYLVVGASDEDSARALATRLESEAPAGSKVSVEGSGQVAYAERPANPFAVFGGLGG